MTAVNSTAMTENIIYFRMIPAPSTQLNDCIQAGNYTDGNKSRQSESTAM
jgi:hypothetical protein